MRILVIGGMHGNEPLGPGVVKLFQENPVADIDAVLANEQAIVADRRFVEQDLNRSFPGDKTSKLYELRRAAELLAQTEGYDLVLDFHNTYCPGNDCGFVGEAAPQSLLDATWALGLERVVVADYDCINKYATNCVSVEVSMDSPLNRPVIWYERITLLARLNDVVTKEKIMRYRFVYRMTQEDREVYELDKQGLRAFQPMPSDVADKLNLKIPAYPIFIGDKFTPYNYGGVLYEIEREASAEGL